MTSAQWPNPACLSTSATSYPGGRGLGPIPVGDGAEAPLPSPFLCFFVALFMLLGLLLAAPVELEVAGEG